VGCVGIWVGGRAVLDAWAGSAIVPDAATMAAMGALLAVQCSLLPADSVLVGVMRHRGYAAVSVVEGLINLTLSIWWVTLLGAFGVILATLVARMSTNWWFLGYKASRILSLPLLDPVRVAFRSFVLPAVAGLVAAWSIRQWDPAAHTLVAAALGCLVAAALAASLQRSVLAALASAK
jgi:hypothetical protein